MNINVDGQKRIHFLHENFCDGGRPGRWLGAGGTPAHLSFFFFSHLRAPQTYLGITAESVK